MISLDPEQLAEIPVMIDALLARGDPLGEWLAIRTRVDGGTVPVGEHRELSRRARALRATLGSRLILTDDPDLGCTSAVRERGLLVDIELGEAAPGRLARLYNRPDASFILRLALRGPSDALAGCVELLLEPGPGRAHLRQLELEPVGDAAPLAELLSSRAAEFATQLPDLFHLALDRRALALPVDAAALDADAPWSARRRTALGRALASTEPDQRRRALLRLRAHGQQAGQLRALLLRMIKSDPEPEIRAAALAVVPQLGELAPAMLALLGDAVHARDS